MEREMAGRDPDTGGAVLDKPETRTKKPQLWRVILHNDDYTTMEFVVFVLEAVFHKPHEEAHRIMLNVHQRGRGECGSYTYEIAETKVDAVHDLARENGYPLLATMEEA
jgi:ATP-dependent Clp protease adaptor protein ClpS